MEGNDYKYDVAFSFVKDDEALATAINDLIQERVATFLYSKKQEEIAGTDGEETFNRVFGEESRIVVVLYRNEWGTTPWTRIEETAIRNRAFEEGYEFVILVAKLRAHRQGPFRLKHRGMATPGCVPSLRRLRKGGI